jgi:hypothetical protein
MLYTRLQFKWPFLTPEILTSVYISQINNLRRVVCPKNFTNIVQRLKKNLLWRKYVAKKRRWSCCLLLLVSCLVFTSTLKMEAIYYSETYVPLRNILHYNQKDRKVMNSPVGFMLSLHFDPEDGSYILLRNICSSSKYTALQTKRP